ncbi:MAG: hypothetical protein R3F61_01555 [Myxococcota bacterium]
MVSLLSLGVLLTGCGRAPEPQVGPTAPPSPVPSELHTESFVASAPSVDYLLVLDTNRAAVASGDLADRLAALPVALGAAGIDYQIGVVTMDDGGTGTLGELEHAGATRYATPADPIDTLASLVGSPIPALEDTSSTTGARGRAAAYIAWQRADEPANTGFFRDEAATHYLFVSDRDDDSGSTPIDRFGFRDFLGSSDAFGAVTHTLGRMASFEFRSYAAWTDGASGSVEDADWAPFFSDVIARSTPTFFALSERPLDPTSLSVQLTHTTDAGPVTTTLRLCVADFDPEACDVSYESTPNALRFATGLLAAGDALQVSWVL